MAARDARDALSHARGTSLHNDSLCFGEKRRILAVNINSKNHSLQQDYKRKSLPS